MLSTSINMPYIILWEKKFSNYQKPLEETESKTNKTYWKLLIDYLTLLKK